MIKGEYMKTEDRNPKTEGRPKSENRKRRVGCDRLDFGFLVSGFFRISCFGFPTWPVVGLALSGLALTVTQAFAADTVEQWGIYEVALNGPTNGNPFLDVRFSAVFGFLIADLEKAISRPK